MLYVAKFAARLVRVSDLVLNWATISLVLESLAQTGLSIAPRVAKRFGIDTIVVYWLNVNELDSVVSVRVKPDDWLKLVRLNTSNLSDHSYFNVLTVLFRDGYVAWWVVFLVGHEHVWD